MIDPPRWTAEELERDRQQAIGIFRRMRLKEPLEAYLELFDQYQGVFEDLLEPELRFDRDEPGELAARVQALAALDAEARAALGRRLRERVLEGHTVDSWADGVLRAAGLA